MVSHVTTVNMAEIEVHLLLLIIGICFSDGADVEKPNFVILFADDVSLFYVYATLLDMLW